MVQYKYTIITIIIIMIGLIFCRLNFVNLKPIMIQL